MPFTTIKCARCNKTAEVEKTFNIGNETVSSLKCGHILRSEHLNHSTPEQIVSLDGKKLYLFQCDGVRFIESASARALVSDEMGLGKTVQSLATLLLHQKDLCPFLAIVKASLRHQWQHMTMNWMGEEHIAQVIESPKDFIIPGLTGYIISYDLLRRFPSRFLRARAGIQKTSEYDAEEYQMLNQTQTQKEKEEESKLTQLITKLGIKTIILDECQQIKNANSQRTVFTRHLCKLVDHVIALSGTPIKNNAAEYFPVLNILKPEMFPKYSSFLMNYCDNYFNGYAYKVGGLRDPEGFLRKTKDFIIRRTRKEVLPDLPTIRRSFQFHELGTEVEQAYIDTFKQFRDDYNSSGDSFEKEGNTLAYLSKLRHLTGLSKINPCIDYIMEIMGSTEDRVTIYTHHIDIAEILKQKLDALFDELKIPPCALHKAGSDALETEKSFEKSRVLICSTLAGGEGLNLQRLCRRFIMLERQWNPANEEQAEARFPRPEGIKTDFIDGVYMVAIGTVDEFFSEIVEKKREIVNKTLSGEAIEWDQSSLIKELAEVLSMNGGRKWQI